MKLKIFTTTYVNNEKKTVESVSEFVDDRGMENQLINLYPHVKYQTLEGFGGAITDSAGYMFSLMQEEQKREMLEKYFGRNGLHYRLVRIPIDSCDFSLEHFEADSDEADETFENFSFERVEKYIIPLLDAAIETCGENPEIMLSPWSPPAYMKTNGERNNGGSLKPEYRQKWADYICRYIEEYRRRGYRVTKLTMQNEPKAVQPWDSCVYTAEEERDFLKDYMYPALAAHHLEDIAIYIWDHNKERAFEWAETIIDQDTDRMIRGIAFHWYSGDHFEALDMIRERFPDKELLLSEACIEYCKFDSDDYIHNAEKYAHEIIGNFNHGMKTFLDWNLLLNEEGGPNHVKNYCDAPFLYDTKNNKLTESNIYGHIWHFSHFIEPGAVRIGFSKYTDKLEITAFQNRDHIVFVLLNRTDEKLEAYIRLNQQCVKVEAEPDSISTGIITDH